MTPEPFFLAVSLALVLAAGGRLALARRAIRQAHRIARSRRDDLRGAQAPGPGSGPTPTVPTRIVVASRRPATALRAHPMVDERSRLRRDPASAMLLAAAAVLALVAVLPRANPTGAVLSGVQGPGDESPGPSMGGSTSPSPIPSENTAADGTTTPGAAPGPSAVSEVPWPSATPTSMPTATPTVTPRPTARPTTTPRPATPRPSPSPTLSPSPSPSPSATPSPSSSPSPSPSASPSPSPSPSATPSPTGSP